MDLDGADVAAGELRLPRDRTDEVPRADARVAAGADEDPGGRSPRGAARAGTVAAAAPPGGVSIGSRVQAYSGWASATQRARATAFVPRKLLRRSMSMPSA